MRVEILNTKEKVEKLLSEKPHLRDDDQRLIANIWHKELSEYGKLAKEISGFELLAVLSEGNVLTSSEGICRCRRKLQEEYPELRGNSWRERHKNEEKIEKDLGYARITNIT